MENDNLTEFLPMVRCTPGMKAALRQIARNSVARNISDHMRYALELYISEKTNGMEIPAQPEQELA